MIYATPSDLKLNVEKNMYVVLQAVALLVKNFRWDMILASGRDKDYYS